jgi:tetratricopeptide (TPR) repeat protein
MLVKTGEGGALLAAAALLGGHALAADKPLYGPPPAWVRSAAIPKVAAPADGSAVQILLVDSQSKLGPEADATYMEVATRILTPQGLAALATLSYPWNPDTETLTFHRLAILRDGRTIDLLAGGKAVTVLRRETNLEQAMLDGELTATVQPEGLQLGDVVDVAVTVERRDPVLRGHSESGVLLSFPGALARLRVRETWPDDKSVRWRAMEGFPTPKVADDRGESVLSVDAADVRTPKAPAGAPPRFGLLGLLELGDFASWADVSGLMAPLYAKAATLAPGSPLEAEIEKIRRVSTDPKTRAEAALRLTQDQVHYVALMMNFGGYVPAAADITWSRRFGDCKGKTALLLALLHGLGVEAQPALVNTVGGDGLDEHLPTLAFNHVLVRARIGGKMYWLDATRSGDRDLDDIAIPNFHWALPVQLADARLEKLEPPPLPVAAFESVERLDATAGLDTPVKAHDEQIYRGDSAVVWRLALDAQGRGEADRTLREHFRSQFAWIEPKSVDYVYDDAHRVMRLVMDGEGKMDWAHNGGIREFDIGDSSLGFTPNFARDPGPRTEAPYAVDYPEYSKWTVQIRLPAGGAGFTLAGAAADVDTTLAGRRYQRNTRIEGGVVTMVAEDRALAPEVPAAEARDAEAQLRDLYRYNVVVRTASTGVGVDEADHDLPADEAASHPPATAAEFGQRGARELERHDYLHAIADFTQAARLEPAVARHLYDRGVAQFEKGDNAAALSDFDAALKLAPDDPLALMARADIAFARGDRGKAEADYARALSLAKDPATVLQRRAAKYDEVGLFDEAARDYGELIARGKDKWPHPANWLNARCWARAEAGRELEAALADCDEAARDMPGSPDILDSRGFVQLRLGRYRDAVSDYDAALRLSPGRAASLFGRGLARISAGEAKEGRSDLVDARALDPKVDAQFARYGLRAADSAATGGGAP